MFTLISIAIRNVLRNRRRTLLTLAALLVGVGAALAARGLMNGVQASMVEATVDGSIGAIQVHRKGYLANVLSTPLQLDFALDETLLKKVEGIQGVRAVAPRLQFAGSFQVGDEALFFSAQAVDPVRELQALRKRQEMFGAGARFSAEEDVLLGDSLMSALGAQVGQEAILLAPDRDGALNAVLARVGGSLKSFMPGEPATALVPLSLAQQLLRMEGRATELVVGVDKLEDTDRVANDLRTLLGPDFEVHTWEQVAPERKAGIQRQNVVVVLVSGVFLVLMLLGVANATLMSVLERTREVGTMMAVGVKRSRVLVLFLLESMAIGTAGALGGALCGAGLTAWLASKGIPMTPPEASLSLDVRPYLSTDYILTVAAFAVLGAALFSLYPAWRASRLRPVEALAGR